MILPDKSLIIHKEKDFTLLTIASIQSMPTELNLKKLKMFITVIETHLMHIDDYGTVQSYFDAIARKREYLKTKYNLL